MGKKIRRKYDGFTLELDYDAIGQILKSDEMVAVLKAHASEVANSAGEGYEPSVYIGKTRANVSVRVSPVTEAAEQDNYENNTLLKEIS